MKYVWARVAHMAHRLIDDTDERQNVIAMLFAPVKAGRA